MAYRTLAKSGFVGPDGKPLRLANYAYEGASPGRRTAGWFAPQSGPNAALEQDLNTLRARSRASIRNNPWLAKGIGSLVANEVGTGIVPRFTAPDADFRKAALELWNDWADEADADGVLNIYGLQALAVRARKEGGECFVRLRPRRLEDGLAVPLQVQVLEAEMVPVHHNVPAKNGQNEIRQGIELNRLGRRVAYWMHRQHPGERAGTISTNDLVRVPADVVIHHYLPLRPGQLRGVPDTAQALIKAFSFDKYDDAELTRKETRAQYTGFIRRPDYGEDEYKYDPFTGDTLSKDADGVPMTDLQPGTFPNLFPGEEVEMFPADDLGGAYADFVRQQMMGIAAGLGMPYELLTGDYRGINDRLVRAILNEFHRQVEQWQDHATIFQVCRGISAPWIDTAVLAGQLPAPDYASRRKQYQRVEWRPQAWAYVHPLQDVQAKKEAVKSGFESRAAVVAARGWDVEEVDRQNAEDAARAAGLGLNYDTNTTLTEEEDDAQA